VGERERRGARGRTNDRALEQCVTAAESAPEPPFVLLSRPVSGTFFVLAFVPWASSSFSSSMSSVSANQLMYEASGASWSLRESRGTQRSDFHSLLCSVLSTYTEAVSLALISVWVKIIASFLWLVPTIIPIRLGNENFLFTIFY
jgi:hypothetical protein